MSAKSKRRYRRNPTFLTVADAAAMSGLSGNAIRWNLRKGYLRGHNDGFRWYISLADLKRWREEYYIDETRL